MPAIGRRCWLNAAKLRSDKHVEIEAQKDSEILPVDIEKAACFPENVARVNFASNANYVMDQFTL